MRAHFAGDVVSPTGNCTGAIGSDATAPASKVPNAATTAPAASAEQLQARIAEFKQDSKNMEALHQFIEEVLQNAEAEATKQQQARESKNIAQPKEKSRQSFADFKNGKVVNRARGLVVRLFDAICNCANTAAAPAQRIKLRGKRAASAANGGGGAGSGSGRTGSTTAETALNEKGGSKKQESDKDRKDIEKKKKRDDAEEQLLQRQNAETVATHK